MTSATANIHKASPGDGYRCSICGQPVKRVPGGHGPTWVHADSGAVAAPNPPHTPITLSDREYEWMLSLLEDAIEVLREDHLADKIGDARTLMAKLETMRHAS